MPISKRQDGWYWGGQGPFPTRAKAAQVAGAAYASGYKEAKQFVVAIDFDNTYDIAPELWNGIIEMMDKQGWRVICVTQEDGDIAEQYDKVAKSIGKVIGMDNVFFTAGKKKMKFMKKNDIEPNIWIDNNPKRIFKDK